MSVSGTSSDSATTSYGAAVWIARGKLGTVCKKENKKKVPFDKFSDISSGQQKL